MRVKRSQTPPDTRAAGEEGAEAEDTDSGEKEVDATGQPNERVQEARGSWNIQEEGRVEHSW